MTDQRYIATLAALDQRCVALAELVAQMRQEIQSLQKEVMQVGETGTFMAVGRQPKAMPQPRGDSDPRNVGLPPMR